MPVQLLPKHRWHCWVPLAAMLGVRAQLQCSKVLMLVVALLHLHPPALALAVLLQQQLARQQLLGLVLLLLHPVWEQLLLVLQQRQHFALAHPQESLPCK